MIYIYTPVRASSETLWAACEILRWAMRMSGGLARQWAPPPSPRPPLSPDTPPALMCYATPLQCCWTHNVFVFFLRKYNCSVLGANLGCDRFFHVINTLACNCLFWCFFQIPTESRSRVRAICLWLHCRLYRDSTARMRWLMETYQCIKTFPPATRLSWIKSMHSEKCNDLEK